MMASETLGHSSIAITNVYLARQAALYRMLIRVGMLREVETENEVRVL